MLKRLLIVAGASFAIAAAQGSAAPAWADQPSATGQNDATEQKVQGSGTDIAGRQSPSDGKGTVSQFAKFFNSDDITGGLGTQHTSNFAPGQRKAPGESATGRLGVGNVARTDGQPGDDPNSHFAFQSTMDGIDCTGPRLPNGNHSGC